jgi:probable F420-dependent oxidoreductase
VTDRPFRFGVNLFASADGAAWAAAGARAEELGYDTVHVPDHLGAPAPFPTLVAMAAATRRVRLGTFVLNAAFWNPTLLAREVAGTDALTDGRLELGLGAGYVRAEFDTAGIDYGTGRSRLDHLAATVDRVRELLADPGHGPAPVQHPVPVLLGGHGPRTLRLAARTAEIVGFTGAESDRDGNLRMAAPEVLAERIALVREAAGERDPELNLLVQAVEVTDDPSATERLHARYAPDLDRDAFLALPTVAVGTAEAIAEKYRALRAEHGVSYLTVLEPALDAFAEVMPLLR